MHKSKKEKKGRKFIFIIMRGFLIALAAILLTILLFFLLLPKGPDMIKGVTYDLKYPGISHYSQISPKVFEKDFKMMKEAGINTIRLYGVPPEFILDLADKYDIKVIVTIVFPGDWTDFNSPYQLQALKREAVRNINRDINRDCIYAWSIWNDAPWTYGSGRGDAIRAYGKEKVEKFLNGLYECVKKHDPLRPVTAATLTLNDESKRLGAGFLDILGYNIYLGVTDWRDGNYDPEVSKKMVDDMVSLSREYKKPVIIAETGYSTYWTREQQQHVISDQLEKVDRKLAGVILFQWADDWSKSGDVKKQSNDVEEHWGLLEGDRKPKGGYSAAGKMFSNGTFDTMRYAIADYFRGGYYAAKKRALKKRWKENIIVDKEIDDLENQMNLKASGNEIPSILDKLSAKFFEKKGFDQFISFLKEYKASHKDSRYEASLDYYIALSGWNKLEFLARENMWDVYYAEKTRTLSGIIKQLESAETDAEGKASYLDILYLEWSIQNDLLEGKENTALKRLEQEIKVYALKYKDATPLITYSKLLLDEGERQVSDRLLREYAANISRFMPTDDAVSLLKEKAANALNSGDTERAKMLYDAYLTILVKSAPKEEAAITMLDLASVYRHKGMYDESIEISKRLLSEFPNSELADDASYAIGATLKEQKSYNKAIKAFRDFIAAYPQSKLTKSAVKEVLSIFTVYGKGTSEEKTAAFLAEVVASYPDSDFAVMARFELASSLGSIGKVEEAAREYQYIIDNYPDSEYAGYAKKNLGSLRRK
ncbi:MAG: tetratricopeptide repeat protein [Candidatus Omnitrophica bacterium]|nr:tetratricopeptide repeat protein [Candidatus Omnitrophota bacterium]